MKGMPDAQGKVLCLDLPDQWLGGVEHEGQWLLVAQQRLDGFQMQLNLEQQWKKKKKRIWVIKEQQTSYWGRHKGINREQWIQDHSM